MNTSFRHARDVSGRWLFAGCMIAVSCGIDPTGEPAPTATRVPKNHRSESTACPAERAAASVSVDTCGTIDSAPVAACSRDSDCTEGTNGRCLQSGGLACMVACTYDTCFSDADCSNNEACDCRQSPSSSYPNRCLSEGNCRIDADCGPGGFCSPSQLRLSCNCAVCDGTPGSSCTTIQTGHGYFCHTPQDSCVDDQDCAASESCNYDTEQERWSCSSCSWCHSY